MSQGGYVTLVGFVAQDPRLRQTKSGKSVTEVRVGATPRVYDKETGVWRDKETSYYTVNCWQRLADHVQASLRKGDPVVVKGRFKTHSYEDRTGRVRTEIEIEADTVGHDLSRGVANYLRHRSQPAASEDEPAADSQARECAGTGPAADDAEIPGTVPGDILDEEAISRFGRELDDAALAARARGGADDHDLHGRTAGDMTPSAAL